MKRFDFNLQRILSLREYREKEWEIKLGEITGRCVSLSRKIEDRIRNRQAALRTWHETGSNDVFYAAYMEEYMQRLSIEQIRLEDELEEAEVRRAEVQQKYLEASKERKVLENLKDKRRQEYYKEQLKTEFRNVDEMNTSAALRKMRQSAGDPGRVYTGGPRWLEERE